MADKHTNEMLLGQIYVLTVFLYLTSVPVVYCFNGEENRGPAQEFVFTIPNSVRDTDTPHVMITTLSTQPVDATLSVPGLSLRYHVTISRHNGADIELPYDVKMNNGDGRQNKTIIVRSPGIISVYAIDNEVSAGDAFQVLSSSYIGKHYYVAAFRPIGVLSYVSVSALNTPTSITIRTLTGMEIAVDLEEYESYRLDGNDKEDLSGTIIHSDKPITAISGSFTGVPSFGPGQDSIITQLIPTDIWGTNHHIFPFASLNSGFVYRVFAGNKSASVFFSDGSSTHIASDTFYQGETFDNTIIAFESSSPVMVVQYMKEWAKNTPSRGDSSMSIIPSVSHYTNDASFPTFKYTHSSHLFYINVVTKCENIANLVLNDDISLAAWGGSTTLTSDDQSMCCVSGEIWRDDSTPSYHSVSTSNPEVPFYVLVYSMCNTCGSSYIHTALGTLRSAPDLHVPDRPVNVTTSTTATTITLTWIGLEDPSFPILHHKIAYRPFIQSNQYSNITLTGSFTNVTTDIGRNFQGYFIYVLADLVPSTSYEVFITPTNVAGVGQHVSIIVRTNPRGTSSASVWLIAGATSTAVFFIILIIVVVLAVTIVQKRRRSTNSSVEVIDGGYLNRNLAFSQDEGEYDEIK